MLHVKRSLADQCLICPHGEIGHIRNQAALCDQFMTTLRAVVNSGELKYDGT